SGKSSIQRVVFHKMAPNDTPYLESTHRIEKNDVSDCSFIKFQIWDFPGQFNFCDVLFQPELIFKASCAVIFVIDAQDDYHEAVNELHKILKKALHSNMNIKFDVFIHKVDCLNDDQKIDIQRDISQRVMSAAEDTYCDSGASNLYIGFHLTTIYDHSIFEAFSKVVQRLIPCLDAFEELLDIFITNSMVDKAFLFDVSSKIYLATDSSVVDMPTYELCCDMIDVVVDVAAIYTPHSDLVDPPFSAQTGATIMLNNDTVLYLRGINQYMALACLMHEESLEKMDRSYTYEREYWTHFVDRIKMTHPVGQKVTHPDPDTLARCPKWLEREFTDRKVRGSNPTSNSRLPLSRLGQPGSIAALVLPSDGMAVWHRKGVTAGLSRSVQTIIRLSSASPVVYYCDNVYEAKLFATSEKAHYEPKCRLIGTYYTDRVALLRSHSRDVNNPDNPGLQFGIGFLPSECKRLPQFLVKLNSNLIFADKLINVVDKSISPSGSISSNDIAKGLIEYNFQIIKDGLQRLLEVSQQRVQDEHVTLLAQQQQQRQRLLDGMHDNDRGAGNFSDIDCEVVDEEEEDDDEDVGRLALGPTAPRVRKQHFDRRLGNSG
ncbi:Ras-related GTP-binding protein D, partial [Clonorchis sinensis]